MPRLLDLFCGAGGCAAGYHRAGFEVVGVDHRPMPRYLKSGASEFIQADALIYLHAHGREFDAIHASPPCQAYSSARHLPQKGPRREHPDLIGITRELLIASGKPWIIENVSGAPLYDTMMLCGSMFGLAVRRHRFFEGSFLLLSGKRCRHPTEAKYVAGRSANSSRPNRSTVVMVYGSSGSRGHVSQWKEAMGIDWMTGAELSQAIPPAYTLEIGHQLLNALATSGTASPPPDAPPHS